MYGLPTMLKDNEMFNVLIYTPRSEHCCALILSPIPPARVFNNLRPDLSNRRFLKKKIFLTTFCLTHTNIFSQYK